jgi:hypothetical protein
MLMQPFFIQLVQHVEGGVYVNIKVELYWHVLMSFKLDNTIEGEVMTMKEAIGELIQKATLM